MEPVIHCEAVVRIARQIFPQRVIWLNPKLHFHSKHRRSK